MALINRISRLFRADLHAVLDQMEEPEALLRQAIRDMEDELAGVEQRTRLCAHEQESLAARCKELAATLDDAAAQLELCFASGKDDLARNLVRRKLETQRLIKHLQAKQAANERELEERRRLLVEHRKALEGMRQKAELIAERRPADNSTSDFDDIGWMTRETTVGDDEVEIAFLQ
jgi:phage shock protein A